MGRVKVVLQGALLLLLSLLLAGNLYLLAARKMTGETPTIFGYSWAIVLSGSMEPAISVDDLVIAHKESHYSVGDIITFRSGSSLTTHRIVEEGERGFVTRGDANNSNDLAEVPQEDVLGKVFCSIPKVGLVLGYLKTPLGMSCLVLLLVLMIEIPYLQDKINENKEGNNNGE